MWSGGLWRQCGQTVRVQFVWSAARICFFHRANRMHKEKISNWLHKPTSWVHRLRCACVFIISSVAIYKDFSQFLYTSENLYQCNMWNELNILLYNYTRFPLLSHSLFQLANETFTSGQRAWVPAKNARTSAMPAVRGHLSALAEPGIIAVCWTARHFRAHVRLLSASVYVCVFVCQSVRLSLFISINVYVFVCMYALTFLNAYLFVY